MRKLRIEEIDEEDEELDEAFEEEETIEEAQLIPIYKPGDVCKEINDDPTNVESGKVYYIANSYEQLVDNGKSLGIYYNCWIRFPHCKMSGADKWAFAFGSVPEWFLVKNTKRVIKGEDTRGRMIFLDR